MSYIKNDDEKLFLEESNLENTAQESESASQYPDKSVTDEVSQILSSLPETATDFTPSSDQWTSVPDVDQEEPMLACDNNDNSSPTTSSSSSEDDDDDESEVESSELDEEESTKRRSQCLDEMTSIERHFFDVRDQLYRERYTQITKKLEEVSMEISSDYLQQLEALQQQKEVKLQVAETLRNLRIDSLEVILNSEKQANLQHLNNDKAMLIGRIQNELDEKIQRLEEDRDNVDTDMWSDTTLVGRGYDNSILGNGASYKGKRNKKKDDNVPLFSYGNIKRKKKPVTVTGPYIVYMLRDADILEDWSSIKRAINVSQRRSTGKVFKKRNINCRFEDGKLFYAGKSFLKGQCVVIKNNAAQSETRGTIVGLSTTEVRIKQSNGAKSKLYIHQLQRGRYALQHR